MKKPICTTIIGVGLLGSMQTAIADDLADFSSLARDVTALSAGIETISPFFVIRDTNSDGNSDLFNVQFRVYAVGTSTPVVLQSVWRSTALPAIPCTSPQWSNIDMENVKFLGQTGSSRAHVAVELVASCQEIGGEYKEAYKTFVYSADLSTTLNSSVWTYAANRELEGFDILKDASGQETGNAMITTMYPIDPANHDAGYNMVVRTVNLTTGALITEGNYAIVRP